MYLIKGIQMYTVGQNFVCQTILFLSLSFVIANTKNITTKQQTPELRAKKFKAIQMFCSNCLNFISDVK